MIPTQGVVLDVETTGTDRNRSRVISYAAMKVDFQEAFRRHGKLDESNMISVVVNPEVNIRNSWIHGITNKHVKDKPTFATNARSFRTFIGNSPIIGFNVQFDIGMLNAEFKRSRVRSLEQNDHHDTMGAVREIYKKLIKSAPPKISLRTSLDRFGIEGRASNVHLADEDTLLTAKLAYSLWVLFNRSDSKTASNLQDTIIANIRKSRKSSKSGN